VTPVIKRWFRAEVRGLESFPPTGGALVVSNHSGGVLTPDWNVLAPALYGKFGYDRPLYTVAHYGVFFTPFRGSLGRLGVIHASRENAAQALRSGAVVLAFPGRDFDAFRPTRTQNVIDFGGRTGYVRTAMQARVPIVPAVSIGGQETQFFVSRGDWLAKRLGLKRIRPGDSAGYYRFPVRPDGVLPGQDAVAGQDRLSGAGADRHRCPVRQGRRRA
jgi:1-acyl-sn-glycerol-3-phosphate acyltransferase